MDLFTTTLWVVTILTAMFATALLAGKTSTTMPAVTDDDDPDYDYEGYDDWLDCQNTCYDFNLADKAEIDAQMRNVPTAWDTHWADMARPVTQAAYNSAFFDYAMQQLEEQALAVRFTAGMTCTQNVLTFEQVQEQHCPLTGGVCFDCGLSKPCGELDSETNITWYDDPDQPF